MSTDTKLTNPKDVIGSTKLSMSAVPDTLVAYAALSFTEGALKYGRYNWRVAGVRASIYHDALRRHISKWWNGEWADEDTQVPHLASALACIGIILDANLAGKMTDDRPPRNEGVGRYIDNADQVVAHLKKLFESHNPHQYTIADTPSPFSNVVGPNSCLTEESLNAAIEDLRASHYQLRQSTLDSLRRDLPESLA